jgi:hypothetical protein
VPPIIETRLLILVCAVLETGTGLALLTLPRFVVRVLLSAELVGPGVATSRLCGLALLSLGVACWPQWQANPQGPDRRAVRALLVYNAAASAYLAILMAVEGYRGVLLVPAVALHAILAALLVRIVVWAQTLKERGQAQERV